MEIRELGDTIVIEPDELQRLITKHMLSFTTEDAVNIITVERAERVAALVANDAKAPRYRMPMSGSTSYNRVGPEGEANGPSES